MNAETKTMRPGETRTASVDDDLKDGAPIRPMRADDHTDADPAVETPVEARQGFLDRPVLMVLIGGLGLAVVAWVLLTLLA